MTLDGLGPLNRRLNAVAKPRGLLRTIQLRAVAEAKARVARKTGYTARTIAPGQLTGTFAIVQAGGAAPFLEFDTKPHIIRPKRKKVLAWPAAGSARLSGRLRSGGSLIFARKVRHPGTKAQPFLVPGAVAALNSVGIDSVVKAWNEAA
jgi:hypothetical protein